MGAYKNPRIILTIPKNLKDDLDELKTLTGEPTSKYLVNILVQSQPMIKKQINLLKKLKDNEIDGINALTELLDINNEAIKDLLNETSNEIKKLGK